MTAIRATAFNIWLFGLTAVLCVLCTPLLLLGARPVLRGQRLWARLMLWGLNVIVGVEVEVRGRPPVGAALVASRHESMWETIAFFTLLRDPCFVLKSELLAIPWYGWYSRAAGMVAVDRDGGSKAMRAMLKAAKTRADEGRPIVIFPEGTRMAPGAFGAHQPGVAGLYRALDLPCVPVALTSGDVWLRRGFIKRPGRIVVEFLPPIPPGLPRAAFAVRLRSEIDAATARLHGEG